MPTSRCPSKWPSTSSNGIIKSSDEKKHPPSTPARTRSYPNLYPHLAWPSPTTRECPASLSRLCVAPSSRDSSPGVNPGVKNKRVINKKVANSSVRASSRGIIPRPYRVANPHNPNPNPNPNLNSLSPHLRRLGAPLPGWRRARRFRSDDGVPRASPFPGSGPSTRSTRRSPLPLHGGRHGRLIITGPVVACARPLSFTSLSSCTPAPLAQRRVLPGIAGCSIRPPPHAGGRDHGSSRPDRESESQ